MTCPSRPRSFQLRLRAFLVLCIALGAACGMIASQVLAVAQVYDSVVWLERQGVQVGSDFYDRYGLFPWQRQGEWRAVLEWMMASPADVVVVFSPPSQVHGIVEQLRTLPTIRRLNLSGSSVTSVDLQQLMILSDLEELILAATTIDDSALDSLTSLSQLRILDVSETRISDAALFQIAGIESLRSVNLFQTKVSQQGLVDLRRARPDLTIYPPIIRQFRPLEPLKETHTGQFFSERATAG